MILSQKMLTLGFIVPHTSEALFILCVQFLYSCSQYENCSDDSILQETTFVFGFKAVASKTPARLHLKDVSVHGQPSDVIRM